MKNTSLFTATNSPTTLIIQFISQPLNPALLQSNRNPNLLKSERKNQSLCHRPQKNQLVIGQCRSSKSHQHQGIGKSSLSRHHYQP